MKLLYLFLSLSLTAGLCAEAETGRKTPTYLMPGVELGGTSVSAKAKLINSAAKNAGKHASAPQSAKKVRIAGTALDLSVKEAATIDTVLVTSFDNITYGPNGEADKRNYHTIEYDKYGYRTLMKSYSDIIRYTYNCDEKGRWLSRTIERQDIGDDDWRFISKEERTLENGHVKSIAFYAYDDENNRPYIEHYSEFAYLPGEDTYSGSIYLADAVITKEVYYSPDGSVRSEERYTWFENAGKYYLTYSWNEYSRLESVISDNMFVATRYDRNGVDEPEFISRIETWVFGKIEGAKYTTYFENGEVADSYSTMAENYFENGDSISIRYDYVDGNFIPQNKEVYSPDFLVEEIDYSKDFNRAKKNYSYEDGQWVLSRESALVNHVLPNGICQLTQIEGQYRQTAYYKAMKGVNDYYGWTLFPAIVNDDNSYVVLFEDSDEYRYEQYSADGVLQQTIKQVNSQTLYEGVSFFVKAAGETEWKPLDEYTRVEEEGGVTFRTVYKTNANGLPQSITEYMTSSRYTTGQEFKSGEYLYSYGANDDFTIEIYEVLSPADISKMYLSEKRERKTLADGSIEYTNWYYYDNGNGKVEDADRNVIKDHVITYYTYSAKKDTWTKTSTSVENEEYVTDNGVTVRITRRLSDDETYAINVSKYEEAFSETDDVEYHMSANYDWNEADNCWVGNYKDEDKRYNYFFPISDAHSIDPISAYNDEYLIVSEDIYEPSYGEIQQSAHTSYEWDANKNDWKVSRSADFEYHINGRQLKTVCKETETWNGETKVKTTTETIECDSEYRKTLEDVIVEETTYPADEEPRRDYSHSKSVFTYNDVNGLIEDIRTTSYTENGEVVNDMANHYTYSKFNIIAAGIEDITADSDNAISINGNAAIADGQWITVYNINGALVASGYSKVDMPQAKGIYLIKAGAATRKAIVR